MTNPVRAAERALTTALARGRRTQINERARALFVECTRAKVPPPAVYREAVAWLDARRAEDKARAAPKIRHGKPSPATLAIRQAFEPPPSPGPYLGDPQ